MFLFVTEMSQEDVYVPQKVEIVDETIKNFFYKFVSTANYTMPRMLNTLALHTAYSCLECLIVLSVEYRYLTGGKGT